MGNIYLDDNSSRKSKNVIFKKAVTLRLPSEREQKIPTNVIMPPKRKVALNLDQPFDQ